MRRIALAAAIILAAVTNLWAQAGQLPAWNVLGNPSAAVSNARSATLNALFNGAFCSTANAFVARVGGSWVCQGLGTGLSFSAGNLTVAPPWSSITGTPTTLTGYGITSPLPYAQGGCNATTQVGCTNNIFPTPTRAGDIAYWNGTTWVPLPGNNSGTQFLSENASGVPAWSSSAAAPIFQNYLTGLGMTWASATTFTVATGVATDSTNVFAMTLGSAITKSTSAWAVGSGNGGLDTGAIAATTWYHTFLIRRSDTGVVDVCFTVTVTGCTTGGNISVAYDQKRRIGSVLTNGSSQFVKWIQDGDFFTWDVPVADVNGATNPGTAAVTRTLTVPTGVRVRANLSVMVEATSSAGAPGGIFISDLSQTDTAASATVWSLYSFVTYTASITDAILGANVQCMTNTSGQVRSRLQASTANTILTINTNGWTDFRGRNG